MGVCFLNSLVTLVAKTWIVATHFLVTHFSAFSGVKPLRTSSASTLLQKEDLTEMTKSSATTLGPPVSMVEKVSMTLFFFRAKPVLGYVQTLFKQAQRHSRAVESCTALGYAALPSPKKKKKNHPQDQAVISLTRDGIHAVAKDYMLQVARERPR